ncbi:MAG: AraC family transcriptional regulator [Micropruina sp.]|uniref:helix-turn-helix domain-containing protein n=1 Tax=Micropruina sp. TaxID=2737536 RepID=UPI0039E708AE
MPDYATWHGPATAAVLWRVRSTATTQHIAPDGVLDLMWFDGRFMVAGADTSTMVVATRPDRITWGLQFAPGVAQALLGLPVNELTDRRVELSELVRVPANIRAEGDVPAALERVFVALWRRADPDRSLLRLAASVDRAARAGLTVREMAEMHDISERSLHRIGTALFGYSPKTLMQIHRFQRALGMIHQGTPLGAAAAAAGYADQSHLSRETKRFTGQTPAELRSA